MDSDALLGKVAIEAARPADIPALLELLRALFAIEADFDFDADRQARGLTLLLEWPHARVLVARDAERVVGMVSAQLVVSTAEGALSAWLEDVCVDKAVRGAGIGRLLLAAALDWARAQGATRAQLLVDLDNAPALGFYERLGWQATRLGARRLSLASQTPQVTGCW